MTVNSEEYGYSKSFIVHITDQLPQKEENTTLTENSKNITRDRNPNTLNKSCTNMSVSWQKCSKLKIEKQMPDIVIINEIITFLTKTLAITYKTLQKCKSSVERISKKKVRYSTRENKVYKAVRNMKNKPQYLFGRPKKVNVLTK